MKEKLKLYRASILRSAVDGSLTSDWRTAHPDTEPAERLLERVLAERRRRWEAEQLRRYESKGKRPPKNWRTRYREPVAPDRDLPGLPHGWCWATFSQIADRRLGKMLDKQKNRGSLHPYLRNVNTRWFRFDLDDLRQMRVQEHELPNVTVRSGDLVVCEGGEPGRCAVWEEPERDIVIQKALHRVRPHRGVSAHYLSFVLAAEALGDRLHRTFTGTGINHLTGESLDAYPIPFPPAAEQIAIVESVRRALVLHDTVQEAIGGLNIRDLRQSVLHAAFTGRLVPQDPNDEPASVLLDRITAARKSRKSSAGPSRRPFPASLHRERRFGCHPATLGVESDARQVPDPGNRGNRHDRAESERVDRRGPGARRGGEHWGARRHHPRR